MENEIIEDNQNIVFNLKELAMYLKCSNSTVRNLIKKNSIPYFKIGNTYHFRKLSIDEWIEKQENKNKELSQRQIRTFKGG